MFPRPTSRPMLSVAVTLFVSVAVFAQAPTASPKPGSTSAVIPVSLSNEQVAATVNGEKILVGDVRKIVDQRPSPFTLTEDQKKQARHAALDALVEDVLMRQYLAKQVPQVNQADFNKEVKDLQDSIAKRKQDLKGFLAENGLTEEMLRRDIVARLQWKSLLRRQYPDDRLKAYYDANKPQFDKIEVRASHILIKLSEKASKQERDQAMQQMLVWRQEILTGKAKFEDVARQYSQCPSKDKGGDIGPFPYKFVVVPEFARVAFSIKKGDISEIVQTPFGLHLIKVTDRTPGEPSQLASIQDIVREVWAQDDDFYMRALNDQRKISDIKITMP